MSEQPDLPEELENGGLRLSPWDEAESLYGNSGVPIAAVAFRKTQARVKP